MKKLSTVLSVFLITGLLGASSIDYLSNRSVDYLRNFARNAATEGADLVNYNPAGLVFLDPGFHINVGNQFIFKDYSIEAVPFWDTTTTVTYESTKPTLLLPNLYAVYRTADWAFFGAFNAPAGGGSLDYEDGIYAMPLIETAYRQVIGGSPYYFALMNEGSMEASSQYLAGTLGASYAISDIFSMGLAGRYVSAKRTYNGQAEFTVFFPDSTGTPAPVETTSGALDVEKTASGIGGIISVDLMPTEDLNIALKYEMRTNLEFETSVTENGWEMAGLPDSSFTEGNKQRRDLPATLSGGLSYRLSPEFTLSTMFNYYFVKEIAEDSLNGVNNSYDNGLDIGLGLDYAVSPRIILSASYLRSNLGGSDSTFSDLEYNLDYNAFGGGIRYGVNDNLALTVAGGANFYEDGKGVGPYSSCTYSKSVGYFGLGAEISF